MSEPKAPPTMAEFDAILLATSTRPLTWRDDLRALFARAIERPAVESAAWDLASDLNKDLRERAENAEAERDRLSVAPHWITVEALKTDVRNLTAENERLRAGGRQP